MRPRTTSDLILVSAGLEMTRKGPVVRDRFFITCAVIALLLGSSPCRAQGKSDAVIEFLPAAASAKMAGDAKLHSVIGGRNGNAKLFGATAGGLQVSNDAGRTWQKLAVAGRDERVFALATHPT